jgi:GNAT superfamily N-acetyltransferase
MTEAKRRSWQLRRLRPSDEVQVMGLFKECLSGAEIKEKLTFDYWIWENKQNPDGCVTLVADDNGRLVGYYGMICRRLKIADKTVKAGLAIDAMVHPLYRHQGMYVAMDKLINELAREDGVQVSMGFPNEQARRGHLEAGWHEIFRVPTMVKIMNLKPFLRVLLRNNPLSSMIGSLATGFLKFAFVREAKSPSNRTPIRPIKSFDSKFDKLWTKSSGEFVVAGIRDSRRLSWRFEHIPHRKYVTLAAEERGEYLAYIVFRTAEMRNVRIGLLVDLLAAPHAEQALLRLLNALEAYLQSKQTSLILCLLLPGRYTEILKRAGYAELPRLLEPKKWIHIVHFNDSSLNCDLMKSRENWHLTFEDTDVF